MSRMTGEELARTAVRALPSRSHANAKEPQILARELGLERMIALNNNENPLGPSPLAIEAIRQAAGQINRYPDGEVTELRQKLAELNDLTIENFICANGADSLITALMQAFLNQGEKVVLSEPAFPVYQGQIKRMGGELVSVPLNADFSFDLAAMLARIDDQTKMVIIISPHNPAGVAVRREDFTHFMAQVPETCLVVMDEAYLDFADPDYVPDCLPYVRQERNILLLRTFSKFLGLAGLRIGYAIAPAHIVRVLKKVIETFAVNILTQAACVAALQDREFIQRSREETRLAKQWLGEELGKLGCRFPPSQANFLFVDVGMDAALLTELLQKRGILVCPGSGWDFNQHIRVSFGLPEENAYLIDTLREIFTEYRK